MSRHWKQKRLPSVQGQWCVLLSFFPNSFPRKKKKTHHWTEWSILLVTLETPTSFKQTSMTNEGSLEGKREKYQVCSVQYCVQQLCTVQCTCTNRPNSCSLDLASLWLYCMLQFIRVRFSFLGLFCVIFYLCVCFCCVTFRFFSNMPTDGLARKHVSKMTYFASSWTLHLNANFQTAKCTAWIGRVH